MPFVGAEHIVKTYLDGERQHTVLQDVTFSLERGELVALTGSSGSGKSTLLNLLSGLDVPTSGTIRIRKAKAVQFRFWLGGGDMIAKNFD